MVKQGSEGAGRKKLSLSESDFIEDEGEVTDFISTGCTILDLAIADKLPGGIAAGRITHIYGAESTAKTAVGAELLGAAQRLGGRAELDDIEGTWSNYFADIFDVDCTDKDKWRKLSSETIESLFDENLPTVIERAKDFGPSVYLIDSLSALPSMVELDKKLDEGGYGTSRALKMSTAMRRAISGIRGGNLALVFIDQARTDIGKSFGDSDVTSGGRALKYYASTRVKLSHLAQIKEGDKVVGVKLKFEIKKNKIGPPFRKGEFRLVFNYGIDDVATNLEWLMHTANSIKVNDNGMSDRRKKKQTETKSWIFGDIRGRGLMGLTRKVEDAGMEEEVRARVWEVWKKIYVPSDRKPKVR